MAVVRARRSEKSNVPVHARKTRVEPPTLDEAIFAAQGLTDDPREQAQIAATLMGVPEDEVRPRVLQSVRARPVFSGSPGRRAVVVERKGPRLVRR